MAPRESEDSRMRTPLLILLALATTSFFGGGGEEELFLRKKFREVLWMLQVDMDIFTQLVVMTHK